MDLTDARASAADREWLRNVYPLYLHDLSEFDDHYYRLNERGLWEPDYLPSWLEEDTDHPLIISESGCRVGFALVNESPSPYLMPGIRYRLSEFFVLRKYRRCRFRTSLGPRAPEPIPRKVAAKRASPQWASDLLLAHDISRLSRGPLSGGNKIG